VVLLEQNTSNFFELHLWKAWCVLLQPLGWPTYIHTYIYTYICCTNKQQQSDHSEWCLLLLAVTVYTTALHACCLSSPIATALILFLIHVSSYFVQQHFSASNARKQCKFPRNLTLISHELSWSFLSTIVKVSHWAAPSKVLSL